MVRPAFFCYCDVLLELSQGFVGNKIDGFETAKAREQQRDPKQQPARYHSATLKQPTD